MTSIDQYKLYMIKQSMSDFVSRGDRLTRGRTYLPYDRLISDGKM